MAIEPNTNIKVYHNVPLDMNEDRSIAWADITAQNTYFHGTPSNILKYNFAASTYQRVRKGAMRVEKKADDLYDCNYLAFQNTNYGLKWFYAFITSVEYVNDITSEITFEIDELQTWYFEMSLQPCLIERCHTTSDNIGQHIEPEPVVLGEYVMNYKKEDDTIIEQYGELTPLSELCVIIAIVDTANSIIAGKMYDGIYGGATLWAFKRSDVAGINAKIMQYIITPESIISIYMIPQSLIPAEIPDGGYEIPSGTLSNPVQVAALRITSSYSLDGYKPRNKKLYTYPYNYYHVDNSNGSSLRLRYEFFEGLQPRLEIDGCISQPCEIMLRPYNYKNSTPSAAAQVFQNTLNTETLTLNTFPICSWNTDGFQAWMVNTGIPYGLHLVGDIMNMGMGVGSASPGSVVNKFMDTYYSAKTEGQKDIMHGNFSNAGVNASTGRQTFYGGRCSITAEYARVIDDFFDKYGYTCMRLQTPNLRARPHWTYIKTRDCSMTGSVPAPSKQKIKDIFNQGITFWKNASEVGNYSLDNTV